MQWLRRRRSTTSAAAPLTESDIVLLYRLLLKREPDAEGLRHYLSGAAAGLTLPELIEIIRASDEYRSAQTGGDGARTVSEDRSPGIAPDNRTPVPQDFVTPKEVLERYSVRDLIEAAEEYYRRIADPTPLMAKPFSYWHEAPQILHDLGLLLAGLELGKAMTVLDFGGGTGWLSRILAQLNCQPICCDVSASALDIGRRLFSELPPIGTAPYEPQFLLFDGHDIDLPGESVDRIISFDAFHHVPNPSRVIAEFGRILRPGGIVGFSEPGRHHSRSPQAQYEMRHHRVLENDIDLSSIFRTASGEGFTALTVKALIDKDLSLAEYDAVFEKARPGLEQLDSALLESVRQTMDSRAVFFLSKGPLVRDSRSHVGLAHQLTLIEPVHPLNEGESARVAIRVANVGQATWLHSNSEIFGIVRLGAHLHDRDDKLVSIDFFRHDLPCTVRPGDTITLTVSVQLPGTGTFRLYFDLVSEGVTWFENVGSQPLQVLVEAGTPQPHQQ